MEAAREGHPLYTQGPLEHAPVDAENGNRLIEMVVTVSTVHAKVHAEVVMSTKHSSVTAAER